MDRYVYDLGKGRTMHLRSANWGEPDMEIRFVVRDGEKEIVSPPLPDVQLSILAHAFADYFFQRTGRIAWPVEESMVHVYERRRQESAERAQHLSLPVAETRAAEEAALEKLVPVHDIATPVATLGADSLLPPGRPARRRIV